MSTSEEMEDNKGRSRISSAQGWEKRIYIPTILAGVIGGGIGFLSKRKEAFGVAKLCKMYAANLSIVTGCYCGARELIRALRASENGDLVNSVLGGISSGAFLGRLQGGQIGAARYAIIFACAGTALDYGALRLVSRMEGGNRPPLATEENPKQKKSEANRRWSWPEWMPIQVLDEEAVAKRERETAFGPACYESKTRRVLGELMAVQAKFYPVRVEGCSARHILVRVVTCFGI